MAALKFEKGSDKWNMFMEYWRICQSYWIPEESDEWWQEIINIVNEFSKKYGKDDLFVRGLCNSFMDGLKQRFEEQRKTHERRN